MIARRWIATCDMAGCATTYVLEGDQDDGKWQTGMGISDNGWTASPATKETFCPNHEPTDSQVAR